jgi:hypothetical protein
MSVSLVSLAAGLLRVNEREVEFERRGFNCPRPESRRHLEQVGRSFLQGYHRALRGPVDAPLLASLEQVDPVYRGFAFEGAGMACGVLDALSPWKKDRFATLLAAAPRQVYLLYVGLGWAWARLPWKKRGLPRGLTRLDPLLGWLVADGLGFHETYFHPDRTLRRQQRPRWGGYAERAFDQGVGRAIWFASGADVSRIRELVTVFPVERRRDLWGGVGLAMAYAGGAPAHEAALVMEAAGNFAPEVAQGVAFGAQARHLAGNITPQAEGVCQVVWGRSASETAVFTDQALAQVADLRSAGAYEAWRNRLAEMWRQAAVVATTR